MAAVFAPGYGYAQNYPTKPIRMIVPFAPGGTTDVIARIIGQKLSDNLGQQVVIDNRPGANGNIGTEMAAKAPADGYTLVMSFDGTMAINPLVYRNLGFDPQKDLAPVVTVAQVPLLIVVHPSLGVSSIKELVALAKAQPARVNYSSAGHGSTGHLTGELLKTRANIEMVHVSYKGGGQALTDLLGGQIHMLVTALPTVEPFLRQGKLKALAFSSAKRVPGLPEVPTIAESGLAGFDVSSWYGILAPAATPKDIIRRLNSEIVKILAQKEVRDRFTVLGTALVGDTPEQFASVIKADTVRWANVVKDANIRLD
jgi:tripartite-type tricarboxylate transporter receptor subunit TctC